MTTISSDHPHVGILAALKLNPKLRLYFWELTYAGEDKDGLLWIKGRWREDPLKSYFISGFAIPSSLVLCRVSDREPTFAPSLENTSIEILAHAWSTSPSRGLKKISAPEILRKALHAQQRAALLDRQPDGNKPQAWSLDMGTTG